MNLQSRLWRWWTELKFYLHIFTFFRSLSEALIHFPKPILSAVNGLCLGFGVAIVALSDLTFTSSKVSNPSFCILLFIFYNTKLYSKNSWKTKAGVSLFISCLQCVLVLALINIFTCLPLGCVIVLDVCYSSADLVHSNALFLFDIKCLKMISFSVLLDIFWAHRFKTWFNAHWMLNIPVAKTCWTSYGK